jgi:PAS domain-containing protein
VPYLCALALDSSGSILFCTESVSVLLLYSEEELLRGGLSLLCPPATASPGAQFAFVASFCLPGTRDVVLKKKDQSLICVSLHVHEREGLNGFEFCCGCNGDCAFFLLSQTVPGGRQFIATLAPLSTVAGAFHNSAIGADDAALLSRIPAAVLVTDSDGIIHHISPLAMALLTVTEVHLVFSDCHDCS